METYQLFVDERHNPDSHQCDLYVGNSLEKMQEILDEALSQLGFTWGNYYKITWVNGIVVKEEELSSRYDEWIEYKE